MSQQALAAAVGVHVNTVARWERSGIDPRHDALPQIAAALECRLDELTEPEPVKPGVFISYASADALRVSALARAVAAYRARFPSLQQAP